ncbi:MAG: LytR/AlgR family response regulator transcription factor, partial [Methanococcaceae archaeon]
MKALIIDDERLARVELKRLLSPYKNINIIGEAVNTTDALDKINHLKPDLIFLDIQMPGKNGFELLEQLDSVPNVIFTTAYDEYALKAFEYNALDYLQKPIEPRRLESALNKVILHNNGEIDKDLTDNMLSEHDSIFVKDGDKCWFVKLAEIRYFESEGNYVRIHFDHFKPLVLKSLNSIDERLDPKTFFRASRSSIINLKWIESIETS